MQTIDPRDTSDVYAGSGSGDVLWDGKGNDVLTGGLGGDIYIFQRGDGHDVISERGGFSFGPGYLPVGWRRGVVKVNMRAAVNHNRASGKRGVVLRNSNQEIAA
jgi:Ca2+-binding RTX toxin-like protein